MIYEITEITETEVHLWDEKTRDEFGKPSPLILEFPDTSGFWLGDRVRILLRYVSSAPKPDDVPNEG